MVASAGRTPVRFCATASSVYPGSLFATTDWNARRKPRCTWLARQRLLEVLARGAGGVTLGCMHFRRHAPASTCQQMQYGTHGRGVSKCGSTTSIQTRRSTATKPGRRAARGPHHAAGAVRRRVCGLAEVQVGGPHARVERLRGVEEEGDLRRRLERRHHHLRPPQRRPGRCCRLAGLAVR
jgi:hypothetical protein